MAGQPEPLRAARLLNHTEVPGPNVRKVLLVDDDAVQLRIRATVLTGAGLDVETSTSAADAISLLRNDGGSTIGMVLTDHIMPDLRGIDFVRELRRILPEMPVLVVSGLPDAESDYDGLNVVFRQKPCPPMELISVVKRSLEAAA